MSMDALTNAAIESLLKDVLPRLQAKLQELAKQPAKNRASDTQIANLLRECMELLQIVHGWSAPDGTPIGATEEELSDEEALMLMNEASGLTNEAPHHPEETTRHPERSEGSPTTEADDELSDDEALAMLSMMEDNRVSDTTAPATPPAQSNSQEEMSDDEAMALLAQMDGDEPTSEPTATPGAIATSAPATGALSDDGEMSDEEALALLAQMDGSEPTPMAEAIATSAPATAAISDDGEMSDDEALRLLMEMDGPAPSNPVPAAAKAAPAPTAAKAAVNKAAVYSAEDEAAALLAQFGGDDDDDAPAAAIPTAVTMAATHDPSHADLDCEEIPEWEANDFQTDPDMITDFNTNCDETMQKLDESILRLEQAPNDKEIIEEIFRGAHTLKGAAGMFGFRGLERVMHRTENLFDLIRKGKLVPNSDVIDVVFQAMDLMRTLLEAVKAGKPCGAKTGEVVKALTLVARGQAVPKAASRPTAAVPAPEMGGGDDGRSGASRNEKKDDKGKKKEEVSTIRVDLERLDALVNLVGELVIDRTRFASIEEELRTGHPQLTLNGNFSETVQLFGRHMNEFQDIIMKVRMVPIGNAFNKFSRIVRDLAKQLNKKIELHISGETAELDKTLVEQIGDPLIHLIRNSCDHGVELPEDRTKKGKPATGNIYLSAYQEGNHIIIKIEDDGKGIPADIIRKKAIEKGMITEDAKLTEREIFALIFEPGFSTAEKVTNVSGRGVGMDVVKKQIMKLKGQLEVDSVKDRGTTITIRLPLTLAIVQSLLVNSHDETFAIPLSSVIESIRITPKDIQKIGEAEVIKLRDKVLPLMHLGEALQLNQKQGSIPDIIKKQKAVGNRGGKGRKKQERLYVVVVGHAERPFGIVVDQLLNQQEMVIKSLGNMMKNIPCVAGGAVLGNGEVVLVLDIPELEESFTAKSRSHAA